MEQLVEVASSGFIAARSTDRIVASFRRNIVGEKTTAGKRYPATSVIYSQHP